MAILNDKKTILLDDVSRAANRCLLVYRDLSELHPDSASNLHLGEHADRLEKALDSFNTARQNAGRTVLPPNDEQAHIQALWLKIKSALGGSDASALIADHLEELRQELETAIEAAMGQQVSGEMAVALDTLRRSVSRAEGPGPNR